MITFNIYSATLLCVIVYCIPTDAQYIYIKENETLNTKPKPVNLQYLYCI